MALRSKSTGDGAKFVDAVKAVRAISKRPIVLISPDAKVIAAGLDALNGETALISGANATNWEAMAAAAKAHKAALVVSADSIDALADLTEKIKGKGVEDLVINPAVKNLSKLLTISTQPAPPRVEEERPIGGVSAPRDGERFHVGYAGYRQICGLRRAG